MKLSIKQVEYLKSLLDDAILVNCPEFEYPSYSSHPDVSLEEIKDLEKKELIGWHDGYNITNEGEKAYHYNKHRLRYHGGELTEDELQKKMLDDLLHTLGPEIRDALESRGVTLNKDLRQFKLVLEINNEEVPVMTMTKDENLVRLSMHEYGKGKSAGMRIMKYKGYSAKVKYSDEDGVFVGEIIDHSASFHGNSIKEARKAFRDMVDFIEQTS